jgi:hypothetical protein
MNRAWVTLALAGILAFYGLFQVRAFVPAYTEVDPDGYLVLAKRIAHWQSPALPDDLFLYNTHVWVENAAGSVVPKFAPGYPAILALVYRVFGDEGMFYVSPVMGGLALIGAFVLFRLWLSPVSSLFAIATLAVNGAFLFYSSYLLPHAAEVCVVTWGMAALWWWLREPRVGRGVAAGLLLGSACTIRHTGASLVFAVAWALVSAGLAVRRRGTGGWAPLGALTLAYAVFPLAMLVYNAVLFGSPVVTGYALSDEQIPLSWRQFFLPAAGQRAPAFSWDALAANSTNLLHGLNYELLFMVFPLGLLGMVFVGPSRERVLRVLWWLPLFVIYGAYYFSPPNLAGYRFLLAVAPLFVGAAYLLLERVTLAGAASGPSSAPSSTARAPVGRRSRSPRAGPAPRSSPMRSSSPRRRCTSISARARSFACTRLRRSPPIMACRSRTRAPGCKPRDVIGCWSSTRRTTPRCAHSSRRRSAHFSSTGGRSSSSCRLPRRTTCSVSRFLTAT